MRPACCRDVRFAVRAAGAHQRAGAAQVGQARFCVCHGPPMAYAGPPLSCALPGRQVGRAYDIGEGAMLKACV